MAARSAAWAVPGVGKSHVRVALGLSLSPRLELLTRPKLLIIGEIGYIPIDRRQRRFLPAMRDAQGMRAVALLHALTSYFA